ncbi:DUF881 domain-containing protein [Clostridium thermosuccinogenes]|nr:DUF881 domain-containing protein [Pseudoclostridium thermosuccinogenes]
MKMKIYRNIALTLVCIILGVMVSWQYKSVNFNQKSVQQNYKRVEEVMDELLSEKHKNELLSQRLNELNKEIEDYKNATNAYAALSKALARAEMIAGLTDVKGPGVIVTLDNNIEKNGYVEETHILSVINELRASDAQAISINGERIVAMSEVRNTVNYIMINGKQMRPPFVIKAIADPDKLESSLTLLGGVKENLELIYHIKVDIKKSDNIEIPKVRDDGTVIKTDKLTPVND